jgi:pimeloyl-ACP methyl ester carboxylesterase
LKGRGRALDLNQSRRRRRLGRALLAGAAVAAPLAAATLLRRRPGPPGPPRWGRARRFEGRLGEIVFQDLGSGPPVVLLHALGPGEGGESWRAVAEILAGRHRVLVPDLPGWGRSPGPPGGAHGPGVHTSAIEDFLEAVVGEPAVVVAAGLTASYAARVAARGDGNLPDGDLPDGDPRRTVRALGLVCPLGLEEDVPALDAPPFARAAAAGYPFPAASSASSRCSS